MKSWHINGQFRREKVKAPTPIKIFKPLKCVGAYFRAASLSGVDRANLGGVFAESEAFPPRGVSQTQVATLQARVFNYAILKEFQSRIGASKARKPNTTRTPSHLIMRYANPPQMLLLFQVKLSLCGTHFGILRRATCRVLKL